VFGRAVGEDPLLERFRADPVYKKLKAEIDAAAKKKR
jgi:hypothetical protein